MGDNDFSPFLEELVEHVGTEDDDAAGADAQEASDDGEETTITKGSRASTRPSKSKDAFDFLALLCSSGSKVRVGRGEDGGEDDGSERGQWRDGCGRGRRCEE